MKDIGRVFLFESISSAPVLSEDKAWTFLPSTLPRRNRLNFLPLFLLESFDQLIVDQRLTSLDNVSVREERKKEKKEKNVEDRVSVDQSSEWRENRILGEF